MGRKSKAGLVAAVLAVGLWFAGPAQAYNATSAANVFAHEALTCVAYYTLLAGDRREGNENMDAYRYFIRASHLLKQAQALVPISRVREKLDLITAKLTARMSGDGGGAGDPSLREYEALCPKIEAAPAARLKYWMDKR